MIKRLLGRARLIAAVLATGLIAYFIAQDPGQATLVVRGYEIQTSVAAVAGLALLGAIAATGVLWLLGVPARMARGRERRRRERGLAALEDALIAAAAGDARAARRDARRAEDLLEHAVAPRLLTAQSAEMMGDVMGAETQYAAMISDPRTAAVGRRGLAAAALSRRDYETAISHARLAFQASPGARWAFDLLFDAQVRAARWGDASDTLALGLKNKHLVDKAARRRKAVLLCATAADLELSDPDRAREIAVEAATASPAFAPASALAARLLLEHGKAWRAAGLLEDSWTAAPHPALALAYRDLKPDEPERARAKRLIGLAQFNPTHRESRILLAEQALVLGEAAGAAEHMSAVMRGETEPSARIWGLMAQIAHAQGDADEARVRVREAAVAPGEPDWSDLDPEGPAFAYGREDWARLVYSYGDTGQLIHPRHERFERARATTPDPALLEGPAADGAADNEDQTPVEMGDHQGAGADEAAPADAKPAPDPDFDPEAAARGG